MAYVDGFLLAVPKKNLQKYRGVAARAGKIWRQHGAVEYRECVAEDVPAKQLALFARGVRLKRNEVLLFSWVVYKTKADRNRVNAKVITDPRIAKMMSPSQNLFDMKRMAYGGFKTIVDL